MSGLKKIVLAAIVAAMLCLAGCSDSTTYVEDQAKPDRFESEGPSCRIVTDSETGVQYLYCWQGYNGGLTVLLNADGTPCVAESEEE